MKFLREGTERGDEDSTEAIKESRGVEKWLERITGTARGSKPGTVPDPFNGDGAALYSTTQDPAELDPF